MQEHRKRWLSLSVAIASGISLGAAAAPDSMPVKEGHTAGLTLAMAAEGEGEGTVAMGKGEGEGEGGEGEGAMGEGEGGMGEGEGGEGEGEGASGPADLKADDQAYLTRLGLIRGHLRVGYELYRDGHIEMAITHMKHPRDELYAGLVPAMEARDAALFDTELSTLAERVTADAGAAEVEAAYAALEQRIVNAETVASVSLKTALLSVMDLVRTAGEEYALGVEEGRLVNRHEYQDAYGFTEIAKQRLRDLPAEVRAQSPETVERVQQLLADLNDLWPDIAPGDSVDGEPSRLYGTAARIEIAALGL
ncbi:hypothetical protein [Chromatocurvus halotolerans]|uniref:YfdX protein n=1 Tax=Chromatocurvus halotolerans TaxID=1132028 RepID=A0A4R2KZA7_9GAMM|nr:hypothetical protein [Chromatocurvus halotolerans]TCO78532.1 hypothetical protein EV688_101349 [Chromatocurvus halotolerans]